VEEVASLATSSRQHSRENKCNDWYTEDLKKLKIIKDKAKVKLDLDDDSSNREEFKAAKRNYEKQLKNNKMASRYRVANELESLKKNKPDEFWRNVNKLLNKKVEVEVEIEELRKEYETLFTTKIINESVEAYQAKSVVQEFISSTQNEVLDYSLEIETVREAVKSLQNGKAIGPLGVSNEMLKYCECELVIECLRLLIETTFIYGVVPEGSNQAIIKPLVKDMTKSRSDVNNCRPISVSDTYSTIFEKILLFETEKIHQNHLKQFGFKARSSCGHAAFVVMETAKKSRNDGLKTYTCAIDASKAFDKVNRFILFKKFLEKTNKILARALIGYYGASTAFVMNAGEVSESFKTTLGVKQGGCISPRLFAIYMEDLISEIERNSQGIRIGKNKIDIILYADDVVLLSNSALGLQEMIRVVEQYGSKNEVKFNVAKTNILIFHNKKRISRKSTTNMVMDSKLKFRLD